MTLNHNVCVLYERQETFPPTSPFPAGKAYQRKQETTGTHTFSFVYKVPLYISLFFLFSVVCGNLFVPLFRKAALKFCYHCSRSVSVSLTPCRRCNKVFYCSRTCKLNSWEERHKKECVRVSGGNPSLSSQNLQQQPRNIWWQRHIVLRGSVKCLEMMQRVCDFILDQLAKYFVSRLLASTGCSQKSAALKPQRSSRPLSAILKSKTAPRPSTVKFQSQRELKLLSKAEKNLESSIKLKENYSYNWQMLKFMFMFIIYQISSDHLTVGRWKR